MKRKPVAGALAFIILILCVYSETCITDNSTDNSNTTLSANDNGLCRFLRSYGLEKPEVDNLARYTFFPMTSASGTTLGTSTIGLSANLERMN
jgi:hypothetical protein